MFFARMMSTHMGIFRGFSFFGRRRWEPAAGAAIFTLKDKNGLADAPENEEEIAWN